ncbi:uncharacterized protein LOC113351617 [Papaver somniferum]|uniref:uncharacterized protein LOC113351617 n=1 Tax=Papaver somniferum TaxID=3469 RepID=UPI000E700E14|nr:uncharacterized protein LOC113351617 [Papaver somniferum]
MQKSVVYFSKGFQGHRRTEVATILGVKQMESTENTDKYLGHQLVKPSHLNSSFDFLEDKFETKTTGWKRVHLSHAGRTMLIKTEHGLIPPFYMATYIIPKKTIAHLTRITRNFWWGHDKEVKKMHYISWEQFELEKEQGGLGIRQLRDLNKAMIAKMVWKFLNDEDFFGGKIMKANYLKNGNLWEAIWKVRNVVVFNKERCYINSVIKETMYWYNMEVTVDETETMSTENDYLESINDIWEPPDENRIKINFDGAAGPKGYACGAVARDNVAAFQGSMNRYFTYCTAIEAEAYEALLAVELAERKAFRNIVIE